MMTFMKTVLCSILCVLMIPTAAFAKRRYAYSDSAFRFGYVDLSLAGGVRNGLDTEKSTVRGFYAGVRTNFMGFFSENGTVGLGSLGLNVNHNGSFGLSLSPISLATSDGYGLGVDCFPIKDAKFGQWGLSFLIPIN